MENIDSIKNSGDASFFGHPSGLMTLFFTEMWERFSYYGMRAILILYMTATVAKGGLEFDTKYAATIYGLYTASVYFLPIIGGWLADRFIGAKRATLIGGVIIMLGHFTLIFTALPFFYTGLVLVAIGTGFLKSNIGAMVGDLYDKDDARRDAGFSIFYMGINLGGFIAPLVCGTLIGYSWHWGFAAAGVGMAFGLLQYLLGAKRLANIGLPPVKSNSGEDSLSLSYLLQMGAVIVIAAAAVYSLELYGYSWKITWIPIAVLGSLIAVVMTGAQDKLTSDDWKRLGVIGVLFAFSSMFWTGFEQAGSSLNLFAEQLTNREFPTFIGAIVNSFVSNVGGVFGYKDIAPITEFPSAYLQSVNSLFIVALAPVFSVLWLRMGKRQPSDPMKFALALFLLSLSFVVLAYASGLTGAGKVSPFWLIVVYLLHTMGELSLSPVGLSSMTKLATPRMVGLMVGVWYLSISLGNFLAGQIAGNFEPNESVLVGLFGNVAIVTIIGAVLLVIISPFVKKLLVNSNQNVER